jgi:glycosyltransferase involved in cell wall biosynthesis
MTTAVVHVVDNLDRINTGIWKAAILGSGYLQQVGIKSYLLVCRNQEADDPTFKDVEVVYLSSPVQNFKDFLTVHEISPLNSIIATHGCWRQPTQLGFAAKKIGFKWIYVPQGMLEPWSLQQKRIKKFLYFRMLEKRWADGADVIRAVSGNEYGNLKKVFENNVVKIENGVAIPEYTQKETNQEIYLFMARLHHKKGIVPLVKAWSSLMASAQNKRLVIAGPDEGELGKVQNLITSNIEYIGPQYGAIKFEWLRKAHYYVLPSFSEGFPSSVIEAMSYGAIPVISRGCNFEAVFELNLGHQIEPDEANIREVLQRLTALPFDEGLSRRNYNYVKSHNAEEVIGHQLYELYATLLKK